MTELHYKPYHDLTDAERAAFDQVRQLLIAHWALVEAVMTADGIGDTARLQRWGPYLQPVVAACDAAWAVLWPDVDPTTIAPGARLGTVTGYVTAAHDAELQRRAALPAAQPLVA